ncbi:glycosyltransferase family A protein [Zunongwangia sp. F260]|uniref:Glycosyltransferase family A protein n=1 Tax=Autumnicola lenta TaxID=3075593 RepID=A0ABU3CG23_9FLAO|nr:glycosyltransferase family A protein [Zunongwangia sp. F260]MDT0645304.1 glycosyltransferase family A protein [Zunongwangia sp. F260]
MIVLIHSKCQKVVRVLKGEAEINISATQCTKALWELAEIFPDEIVVWCEKEFENELNFVYYPEIFHHDLIMASYAIKTEYLPDAIGYIDQLPFVNVNQKLQYPTWRMSADVGGIKGKTLLKFKNLLSNIEDLNLVLNSIAKLGQQHGLFCYSSPLLIKEGISSSNFKIKTTASKKELFSFVYLHYKGIRTWLLLWCFIKYENSFPLEAFLLAILKRKYFKEEMDFSDIKVESIRPSKNLRTFDVLIPTLGRKKYLLQVLEDLKFQSLLPNKVIIVEQNPDPDSQTELQELKEKNWPYKIIHHFTHRTGACNARNIGLAEVEADWIFFADDDIRIAPDVLAKSIAEIGRLGVYCLNINCRQEGEATVFHKIKQWGSFGSGTSIVKTEFCKNLAFDEVFEYGFGEDIDYGMQLRNAGCDIIYHPELEILHLKAPRGGFREIRSAPWEEDQPKPSPTLMVYASKYYTHEQLRGFKNELFLRYYFKQEINNPFNYLKMMRKRWGKSEEWADKLMQSNEVKDEREGKESRITNQESRS